jgi:hypothetical protein
LIDESLNHVHCLADHQRIPLNRHGFPPFFQILGIVTPAITAVDEMG